MRCEVHCILDVVAAQGTVLPQDKNVFQADLECSVCMEDTLINICEPTGSHSVSIEENNIVEEPIQGQVSVSGTYFLWIISWLLWLQIFHLSRGTPSPLSGIWGRLVICKIWGSQRPLWRHQRTPGREIRALCSSACCHGYSLLCIMQKCLQNFLFST